MAKRLPGENEGYWIIYATEHCAPVYHVWANKKNQGSVFFRKISDSNALCSFQRGHTMAQQRKRQKKTIRRIGSGRLCRMWAGKRRRPSRRKKRSHIERLRTEYRRKGGGSRQTTIRMLGGKLDRNGAPFHKEYFQFEDARDGPRVVEAVQIGTCSFGHTIDEKIRVAGICEIGGEVLCSTPGCARQCVHCGAVVCRAHRSTYGDVTYCQRHAWRHYWRLFWRLD